MVAGRVDVAEGWQAHIASGCGICFAVLDYKSGVAKAGGQDGPQVYSTRPKTGLLLPCTNNRLAGAIGVHQESCMKPYKINVAWMVKCLLLTMLVCCLS